MEISRRQEGRWTVLSLAGDLDTKGARELQQVTRELLAEGERELVVDLGGVQSLSGYGLRALLSLAKRVSQHGSLVLCSLTSEVQSSLEVSDLAGQFQIAQDRQQAVDVLAEQPKPSALTLEVSRVLGVPSSVKDRGGQPGELTRAVADCLGRDC